MKQLWASGADGVGVSGKSVFVCVHVCGQRWPLEYILVANPMAATQVPHQKTVPTFGFFNTIDDKTGKVLRFFFSLQMMNFLIML